MTDAQLQSGFIFASVAIPAFDEGQRLPHMLHQLERRAGLLSPPWTNPGGSKVVPLLDPLRMLMAIPRMRRQMAPQSGAVPAPQGLLS